MKMCVCHKSKNLPYCDGTHNKVLVENSKGTPFIRVDPKENNKKTRKLLDGSHIEEQENAINLTIYTKAPEKWKLIDLETGQEYIGLNSPDNYGKWKRIKDKEIGD